MSVVLGHVLEKLLLAPGPFWSPLLTPLLVNGINLGRFGVALFFCISGFVIPFSLNREPEQPAKFIVRRLFRLYPAYWTSLAIAAAFTHPSARALVANITMAQRFVGEPDILRVYWTLAVELMFYASCVALFFAGKLDNPAFIRILLVGLLCTSACGAVLKLAGHRSPYPGDLIHLGLMFYGQLFRLTIIEKRLSQITIAAITLLLLITCYLYTIAFHGPQTEPSRLLNAANLFNAYICALATFAVGTSVWKLRSKLTAYLGTTSYSAYLFHPLSLAFAISVAPPTGAMAQGITLLVGFIVTTVLASICGYHLIERPMIELGRRVERSIAARQPQPSPASAEPPIKRSTRR
jgi:peptidoglycan/LPS O-acetylase OafA/YrhL